MHIAQVAKFFCWLIAKDRNKLRNIFSKTICLYLTMLIDGRLPELSCVTLLQIWLRKLLTMLFYQKARFESHFWRLINSDVFLLKRCCVFFTSCCPWEAMFQNHENLALIFETAFNCFAKNELKSLSCRKSEPPAKMQRTTRKLCKELSCKHSDD